MPPRRGIVKSGNAGNSSKSSPKLEAGSPSTVKSDAEKPLFPPGSKYPLNLLNERCQKNDWKAVVDVRQHPDGYAFVVNLSRLNKKTSERESVRLEPHPPKYLPSALEARHWGATYGLYRFCNALQLNRVLPPGPREYWNELSDEKRNSPQHMAWMWDADPFAARKEVSERQEKAAKKEELSSADHLAKEHKGTSSVSDAFAQAIEVKMSPNLRDFVENSVKKAIAADPEASISDGLILAQDEKPAVLQQLIHLGFTSTQARKALDFLSRESPMTSGLLRAFSPLDASMEYLILHVPEESLPARFLPASNSSNPFITSMHRGVDDLQRRWMEDEAVKAGWPKHAVEECMSHRGIAENWPILVRALGSKLIGRGFEELLAISARVSLAGSADASVEVEVEVVHSLYPESMFFAGSNKLTIPLPFAAIDFHVIMPSHSQDGYPPSMYLTSRTVPAYIRLHLLARLLAAIVEGQFSDADDGLCLLAVDFLEQEWSAIEQNGPPELSAVIQHLLPCAPEQPIRADPEENVLPGVKGRARVQGPNRDRRLDSQVRADFELLRNQAAFIELSEKRKTLPAFAARDHFLGVLERNRVVVVVGETGCGKTTQLPQFILDSLILSDEGATASLIVTQPRRISAVSVAARVSAERLDDGSVGYAIRGESKLSKRTKLLFCTTGVVLRRISSGDDLREVTHVIVDEVHERSVDGDFLLLELKELLTKHSKLKVILMSATINHETFVKYFNNAPLVVIPGLTPHPVTDMYLEDIIPMLDYQPTLSRPTKKGTDDEQQALAVYQAGGLDAQSISAIQSITRSERVDFQLIAAIVAQIVSKANKKEAILIFMSGVQEIRQCMDALHRVFPGGGADIFPLHANLSSDEQRRVFTKSHKWKIIVATNVAETSITIDDVVHVIDAGRVKEIQYDTEAGLSRLVETWVTRAGARQRRGRAGRTQAGTCYKLYTRRQENNMLEFPVPEILRTPLERISLTIKAMRAEENVKLFLSRAIDPPETTAMNKAWSVLEDLGAVDENGRLTALGQHMSLLPVDLRLAKMLILGTVFQCLGPILTVAACLSSKPLFLNPIDKRDESSSARRRFATGNSDLLTDMQAYDQCTHLRLDGKGQSALKNFCDENFISMTTVRDITSLRQEFVSSLSDLGFIPLGSKSTDSLLNINTSNENLVKAVILGGLWPRVARVTLPKSAIKFDKVQGGTVQRENEAKEYKIFDIQDGRVFLHPASILFSSPATKSPFLAYFHKHMTTKVFLRDATEVPLYGLLLFGGTVSVNHVAGGLTVRCQEGFLKLKAWPRIGVLVNQLRRLLDTHLKQAIEQGSLFNSSHDSPVLQAMLALLTGDGMGV